MDAAQVSSADERRGATDPAGRAGRAPSVRSRGPAPLGWAPGHARHGPVQFGETLRSPTSVNALVHLYRAEVGKMTAFRVRLDTTTNWGITASAAVITFSLGNQGVSHAAFLFLMAVLAFFLNLEARRFRAYESSRYRVLLLERYFYPSILGDTVDERWAAQLVSSLEDPGLTVDRLGALGWRLRRTYLWLYAIVLATWLSKLDLIGGPESGLAGFVARAAIGSVPGWFVTGAVALFYVGLAFTSLIATRRYPWAHEASRHQMEAAEDP